MNEYMNTHAYIYSTFCKTITTFQYLHIKMEVRVEVIIGYIACNYIRIILTFDYITLLSRV